MLGSPAPLVLLILSKPRQLFAFAAANIPHDSESNIASGLLLQRDDALLPQKPLDNGLAEDLRRLFDNIDPWRRYGVKRAATGPYKIDIPISSPRTYVIVWRA